VTAADALTGQTIARPTAHEIDTAAMKLVQHCLPDAWEPRVFCGRDFGLDIAVEVFDGGRPTGDLLFFHVKGTQRAIRERDLFVYVDVPVRTLRYAELFDAVPVLLALCPTQAVVPHFYSLWIQEYIRVVLDRDRPDWRDSKSTIRVCVPVSNEAIRGADPWFLRNMAAANRFRARLLKIFQLTCDIRRSVKLRTTPPVPIEWIAGAFADDLDQLCELLGEAFLETQLVGTSLWSIVTSTRAALMLLAGKIPMSRDNIRAAGWSDSTTLEREQAQFEPYGCELGRFVIERLEVIETIVRLAFDIDLLRHRWDTNRIHTF
jgi:hypothetical protein